jgi:hypothetical protein
VTVTAADLGYGRPKAVLWNPHAELEGRRRR